MNEIIERKQENLQAWILGVIDSLQRIPIFEENGILKEELQNLRKKTEDRFFKVAVVGEFSSGKSTFINALIKKDLLKHGAKETTATLTKIINVRPQDALQGKGKVLFRDGGEKTIDTLDEITAYTTTSSDRHSVSKEIESFEIYLHFLDTDLPVMIIDTPGLNGMAEHHREQTILQLKEAHACIYLMQLRGLSQSDKDFIRFIMHYQHDFIFLQNFIDELKELEGETTESKLAKQREILKQEVFMGEDTVRYEVCGISSRNALLARDPAYGKEGCFLDKPIDEFARRKLLKSSNFEGVMSVLTRLMKDNHKGLIKQRTIMENLLQFLEYAEDLLHVEEESLSQLWLESDEGKLLKSTAIVKERLLEQQRDHKNKLENFVYAKVHELSRFARKKITMEIQNLETDIVDRIRSLPTLESLERYIETHEIEKYFSKKIPLAQKTYLEFLEAGFQDILSNAVLRIHEYTGGRRPLAKVPEIHMKATAHEVQKFTSEEDNLMKINREIAELATEDRKMSLEILRIQKKKEEDTRAYEKAKEESLRIKEEFRRRENRIGTMPPKEKKEVKKIVHVSRRRKHRIIGGLLDFVLGEEQVPITETVEVNTNRNQWQEKKRKLQMEQKSRQEELNHQLSELEMRISEQQRKARMLEQTREMKEKRAKSLESLYASTRETLETKKRVAMEEYMNLIRKSLFERIHAYLYEEENIQSYFEEHAMEYVSQHREKLLKKVLAFYEAALLERLKRYEELLQGMPRKEKTDFQKELLEIGKYKKEMEECLCQLL